MSPPVRIARLTPNGEIRTADLLSSIAQWMRQAATLPNDGHQRPAALRRKADQLDRLAKAMEVSP